MVSPKTCRNACCKQHWQPIRLLSGPAASLEVLLSSGDINPCRQNESNGAGAFRSLHQGWLAPVWTGIVDSCTSSPSLLFCGIERDHKCTGCQAPERCGGGRGGVQVRCRELSLFADVRMISHSQRDRLLPAHELPCSRENKLVDALQDSPRPFASFSVLVAMSRRLGDAACIPAAVLQPPRLQTSSD